MVMQIFSAPKGFLDRGSTHLVPRLQCHSLVQRQKRQRCCASESQSSELGGQDPENEPLTLPSDWRKFRADLIAMETRQRKEAAKQADLPPVAQLKIKTKPKSSKRSKSKSEPKSRTGSENKAESKSETESDSRKDIKDIWAHRISAPETGCLLLSRRSAGEMGFFNDCVILMLRHENARGSCGLLLGRRSGDQHLNPLNQVLSMFSKLHSGGPVNQGQILLLHGPPAMTHSEELFTDVYLGGWPDAQDVLVTGEKELPEMTVFCGSCGWGAYQLETEEKMGSWVVVSASAKCMEEILRDDMTEGEIREKIRHLADLDDV